MRIRYIAVRRSHVLLLTEGINTQTFLEWHGLKMLVYIQIEWGSSSWMCLGSESSLSVHLVKMLYSTEMSAHTPCRLTVTLVQCF